ncbi:MAG TPA: hypothetical protein VLG92_04160 [Candidatus Saccharimonadia bacterium]|nr:hypothetical protein [Candidatus Saccharimonadia bacterium]
MGLFDSVLKQVDKSLKAVESGALEKRLGQFADAVEKRSVQAEARLDKVADKPGALLQAAEAKKDVVTSSVQAAAEHAKKGLGELKKH